MIHNLLVVCKTGLVETIVMHTLANVDAKAPFADTTDSLQHLPLCRHRYSCSMSVAVADDSAA